MNRVFVYGTLKEGFANFAINAGRRVPGTFQTVERFPLYVISVNHVPWLVNRPGVGEHVLGQIFEVDDGALHAMDRLERVNEAGWYSRVQILVHELSSRTVAPTSAFVYFGAAEKLQTEPVNAGPLSEFTLQQNSRYRRSAT